MGSRKDRHYEQSIPEPQVHTEPEYAVADQDPSSTSLGGQERVHFTFPRAQQRGRQTGLREMLTVNRCRWHLQGGGVWER